MINTLNRIQRLLDQTRAADFLGPLAIRLYLVPVFYAAGIQQFNHFDSTVQWFGNVEWGLGLPFPWLMAAMATAAELGGALLLAIGFATRWISIPLMITMVVAMLKVHWQYGWLAIATGTGIFATERTEGAVTRLDRARSILQEYGNYPWLTEHGNFVVLNNGIEFAATYFVMLLALFFTGGGRYVSVDYWLVKYWGQSKVPE